MDSIQVPRFHDDCSKYKDFLSKRIPPPLALKKRKGGNLGKNVDGGRGSRIFHLLGEKVLLYIDNYVTVYIVYPPEVRRGEYWRLGVFLLQYFPLIDIYIGE